MRNKIFKLPYGGTPDYATLWTLNQCLNIIRRILITMKIADIILKTQFSSAWMRNYPFMSLEQ